MTQRLDLAAIRNRLAAARGKRYWRCLEELAETPEFRELLEREFPQQASVWAEGLSRRQFLTLLGASLALAGLSGCTPAPARKIVPYVREPERLVPGKPLFFATAMTLGGAGVGLLVESNMGRPTKIEGNPEHPASQGATDLYAQASILTLYDPDRSQTITFRGRIRAWSEVVSALRAALENQRPSRGAGLRILTETIASPTLTHQLELLLQQFPAASWVQYEPVNRDAVLAGTQLVYGQRLEPYYQFDKADVIVSLEADFLSCGPAHLRQVRDFTSRRRVFTKAELNRLYVVESTPTLTGAVADHRLPLRAAAIDGFARALAARLGLEGIESPADLDATQQRWLDVLAKDLQDHCGRSLVVPGDYQPAAVHALAQAMNHALGNVGKTVSFVKPIASSSEDQMHALRKLTEDMQQGRVQVLLILGGNPVYTAPADLHFLDALKKVPLRLHLSLHQDETSRWCDWHVNEAHFLEAWGDTRAFDGTVSIVQPLIAPLYGGKSALELLSILTSGAERHGRDLVRDYWRSRWEGEKRAGDFERFWRRTLHDGFMAETAFARQDVVLRNAWAKALPKYQPPLPANLEIIFRPDPTVYDGRFANNGWLQELPKPPFKLTWDNAALLSPATAQLLGLSSITGSHGGERGEVYTDVVELRYRDRAVTAPVWIVPGHPDNAVTVHLGYGRSSAGRVGNGAGFNAYTLRMSERPWFDEGLVIRRTGKQALIAAVQHHHIIAGKELDMTYGRGILRVGTLEEFRKDPHAPAQAHGTHAAEGHGRTSLSLYPGFDYSKGNKWGMVIDLTACTGCSACVIACQAENNIPIVGKDQVTRGREMHWLRIDRYYEGDPVNPNTYFQPVPCMHCENAPCEVVCPVSATTHSPDGLNEMTYNRCVGTRYCANNCPYKVRRFNFFQYADYATESLKLQRNPEVTVRSRGIMEKCTYCVQRIRKTQIEAEKEGRPIRDGEVQTACQAACPAGAIVFGDLNDPQSQVARLAESPLNYGLLTDLNTRPRTTYLAVVRNPNPALPG